MRTCKVCTVNKSLDDFYFSVTNGKTYYRWQCKSCEHERNKAYLKSRGDYNKKRTRDYTLSRYGLTVKTYEALLASQGGGCAICGSPDKLHVDHDHACCPGKKTCGKCVRGILCSACNTAIGSFGDDISRLEKAIEYIRMV